MSEIGEGLGSAIEGALAGRAAEPSQGEGSEGSEGSQRADRSACLNCGTELIGAHCHSCGQKAHIHRTIAAIGHDIVHGVLHLDGKLWRTLPLLAFKPGKLTRRYIDGERANFVSPMAMFLFTVFAMFAIFQVLGISAPTDFDDTEIGRSISEAQRDAEAELASAKEELAQAAEGSTEQKVAAETVAEIEDALAGFDGVERLRLNDNTGVSFTGTGIKSFDEGLVKKWRQNPGLMLYKVQNNAYKFSWLLIPLSIPFVWLLFAWKRRFKAYDHAIFVTYSLAFMSLLFIAISIAAIAGVPGSLLALIAAIIPPVHIYKHVKGSYELSRFSALWRTLLLVTVIITVVLTLFMWLLVVIGAF